MDKKTEQKIQEQTVLAFLDGSDKKVRRRGVVESMLMVTLKEMEQEEQEAKAEAEAEKLMERKFCHKKEQDEYEDEQAIKTAIREVTKTTDMGHGINVQGVFQMLSKLIDGIDMETCEEWVNEYDLDFNGIIHISEFVQLILGKIIVIDDTESEIIEAFKIFDPEDTGFIESTEMRKIMQHMGDRLNDEEINSFMKKSDIDGEGFVNYEEFVKIMYQDKKDKKK